jgi:four helix bundle protein
MKIEKFEDIISWQKGQELSKNLYTLFKDNRDFSFKDQILRAALSISNNIAEGFERQTNKELKQFLFIAKGSCGEVRSMLYTALSLKYIQNPQFTHNYAISLEISRLLSGFIKRI